MLTINGPGEHAVRERRAAARSTRLAAMLGALLLLSVGANALTIIAGGDLGHWISAIADGAAIGPKAETSACRDDAARQPAAQPFRGANAPALHF